MHQNKFQKKSKTFVYVLSFSLFPLFSHLKVSSSCFIFPITCRKYVFYWLHFLLWNFSTCICPDGMKRVSTELITNQSIFATTLTRHFTHDTSRTQFYYYRVLILSRSFSGNFQQFLNRNHAA